MPVSQQWRWRAACRTLPTDWFYGYDGEKRTPIPLEARKACAMCPVFKECREYAILSEDYGFWAGLTARQRRRIRKELGLRLQAKPPL